MSPKNFIGKPPGSPAPERARVLSELATPDPEEHKLVADAAERVTLSARGPITAPRPA
jgi:hypothetical protein